MKRKKNNMRFRKEWTTHMPMLIKTVQMTKGPVLELGSGFYSTPLLHWLLAENRRRLVTYEDVEKYYDFSKRFRSRTHSIHLVKDWDKLELEKRHWSVVLIDHTTERRAIEMFRLKDCADYIVIHDSELPTHYGYDKIYPYFKYVHHWKFCMPYTTVVSNFKDLSDL